MEIQSTHGNSVMSIIFFLVRTGKIVSAIRRYPDMRADMINDDYIVIPQYYRSGCIVIQKI